MSYEDLLDSLALVIGLILAASLIEAIIPFKSQSRRLDGRRTANLGLTALTLTLGIAFNAAFVAGAIVAAQSGFGVLRHVDPLIAGVIGIVVLDFATYVAHVAMHKIPWLWRVHLVHHSDTAVDATTALRQHPLEGLLRFAFIAAPAWALGVPPEAAALYRLLSVVNAVFEHANIRLPRRLEKLASQVWITPTYHKLHHARERRFTDSNYGNLFAFFDRAFATFTPMDEADGITYGLDGYEAAERQSLPALLRAPFARRNALAR